MENGAKGYVVSRGAVWLGQEEAGTSILLPAGTFPCVLPLVQSLVALLCQETSTLGGPVQ